LRVSQISHGIEYKYVRTREEYNQVLELRRLAYGSVGKLTSDTAVADKFDTRSRIIIGVYKGAVVASTRLIFNEIEDKMEHEQFVTFDSRVPSKDQICEITRVCTHPDFRGADLLIGLVKFVSLTVAQSGRRYVLGCATDTLLPMYTKMGFRSLNIKYSHEALNNIQHTIFMCDITEVAVGKGINPIAWNILWADVVEYISQNQIMRFDPASNVRIGIYNFFKPIAKLLLAISTNRRRSRSTKKVAKTADIGITSKVA
jgi:predicted GNAT family N-acyltransferase